MSPNLPRGSHLDHGQGYAGPKTVFFYLSGLESLKLAFLKLKLKFNSAALWIIRLQTHQAPGVGHFLLFPAPHSGGFVTFCVLFKLIPTYIPGWGGSGFTLTGASSINIDNQWKSIITNIFVIDWSFININRLIDIDCHRLLSIVIDYRFHRLFTSWLIGALGR